MRTAWWLKLVVIASCLGWGIASFGQQSEEAAQPLADGSILAAPPLPDSLRTSSPRSLEEMRLLEGHVQRLLARVRPATVALTSGGSGVVVSEDGLILTCAHVNQRPGNRIAVIFPDGSRYPAVTLGNNHGIDAGLVKITEQGKFPFAELGTSADVTPGQWCLAVGYPVSFVAGKEPAVRIGRIQVNKPRMMISDCPIMGGDSGGPLFDLDGKVIAINSRVNNSVETNIHVPVDAYRDDWERLVASLDWSDENRRPYLGITRDESFEQVVIKEIKTGSPAEKAGVEIGDRVVEFDGQAINNFEELLARMRERNPRDRVKITVRRQERTLVLSTELDYWPNQAPAPSSPSDPK